MTSDLSPKLQGGAALLIVMVVMLLITILALATLRTGTLEERIGSNLRDRNLMFESAESALRKAEQSIGSGKFGQGVGLGINCSPSGEVASEQCAAIPSGVFDQAGAQWVNSSDIQREDVSAGPPQYMIQYMGSRSTEQAIGLGDEPNYGVSNGRLEAEYLRVTARGGNPVSAETEGRSTVVLQSTIVRE